MYRRPVKPPPKVIPQDAPLPAGRIDDDDFEAAVRMEMERLERELKEKSQASRLSHAHGSDPPYRKEAVRDYHDVARPNDYDDDGGGMFPAYDGVASESPRRAKGDLHGLYGPDDDRRNMKAAKAAAYSHQLNEQRREQERQYHQRSHAPSHLDSYSEHDTQPNGHRLPNNEYDQPRQRSYDEYQQPQQQLYSGYQQPQQQSSSDYQQSHLKPYSQYPPQQHAYNHYPLPQQQESYYSPPNRNPQHQNVQSGMVFGRDEKEEKALRRARQAEYRRQLEEGAKQKSVQHQGSKEQSLSPDRRAPNYPNSNHNPYSRPQGHIPPRHAPSIPDSGQVQDHRPFNQHQHGPEDYHFSHDPLQREHEQGSRVPRQMPHMQSASNVYSGRVNAQSLEGEDKATKRRRQEEYRKQLEEQARQDAERKEALKKQEEEMDREDMIDQQQYQKGDGSIEQQAGRHRKSTSPSRQEDHDSGREHSRHNRHQHYDEEDNNLDQSPSKKSPTKARNRLISDVYGGGNFVLGGVEEQGNGGEDWKISKRGSDANAAQKKAARIEQQRALEAQIAEKKRLKEEEEKRQRLEDERLEQKAREAYGSPNRKKSVPPHTPSQQNQVSPERDKERDRDRDADIEKDIAEEVERERARISRLEMAAVAAATNAMRERHAANSREQQRPSVRHEDRDIANAESDDGSPIGRRSDPSESPSRKVTGRTRYSQQQASSRSIPSSRVAAPQIPMVYPLLEDLGIHSDTGVGRESFQMESRRAATPGGSLESVSVPVPVPETDTRPRDSHQGLPPRANARDTRLGTHVEESYEYRDNVDDEDLFVVDWQHNRGFPTRRGTTPMSNLHPSRTAIGQKIGDGDRSIVSNSKLVDPAWGPDGLLADLAIMKVPPRDGRQTTVEQSGSELSMVERSLASESLLMFMGNRTPQHSAQSQQRPRELDVSPVHASSHSSVPKSPLTALVNSQEKKLREAVDSDRRWRNNPHSKYDPRRSDEQLDRLIAQSGAHIRDNLLLQSGGFGSNHGAHSRPLTSAGRKLASRDSDRREYSDHVAEDEVLVVPSAPALRISHSGPTDGAGYVGEEDALLSSCGEFNVQSATAAEKEMMQQMIRDQDEAGVSIRDNFAANSFRPATDRNSSSNTHMDRPSSRHSGIHETGSRPATGSNRINPDDMSRPESGRHSRGGDQSRPSSRHSGIHETGSRPTTGSNRINPDDMSRPESGRHSRGGDQSRPSSRHSGIHETGSRPATGSNRINPDDMSRPSSRHSGIHETGSRPTTGSNHINPDDMSRPESGRHSRGGDQSRPSSRHSGIHGTGSRPATGSNRINPDDMSRPESGRHSRDGDQSRPSSRHSGIHETGSRPTTGSNRINPDDMSRPESGRHSRGGDQSRPSSRHSGIHETGSRPATGSNRINPDDMSRPSSRHSGIHETGSRPTTGSNHINPDDMSRPESGRHSRGGDQSRPSSRHSGIHGTGSRPATGSNRINPDDMSRPESGRHSRDGDQSRPSSRHSGIHETGSRPTTGSNRINPDDMSRPESGRHSRGGDQSRPSSRHSGIHETGSRPATGSNRINPDDMSRPESGRHSRGGDQSRPSSRHSGIHETGSRPATGSNRINPDDMGRPSSGNDRSERSVGSAGSRGKWDVSESSKRAAVEALKNKSGKVSPYSGVGSGRYEDFQKGYDTGKDYANDALYGDGSVENVDEDYANSYYHDSQYGEGGYYDNSYDENGNAEYYQGGYDENGNAEYYQGGYGDEYYQQGEQETYGYEDRTYTQE